jgi:hypothetical protein
MTNLLIADHYELAMIARDAYYDDFDRDDYLTNYRDSFDAPDATLRDALAADIDDLLKNRNEFDLFPDTDQLDADDAERFFDRIYRTPLCDSMIDELSKLLA